MQPIFKIIIAGIVIVAIAGSASWLYRPQAMKLPAISTNTMRITSPTFTENAVIPDKYGCHGANINPALEIKSVPANAKSLALILDDPDASGWSHWILWNIDPKTTNILENYAPAGAVSGLNDFGANNYGGPCPPSGSHRYEFTLYALDTVLNLPAQTDKTSLIKAFNGHILDSAKLTGIYKH